MPSSQSSASTKTNTAKRTRNLTDPNSPNLSPDKKKVASGTSVDDTASSISSTQQTYRAPPPVNYQPQFTTPNPFDAIAPPDDDEDNTDLQQEEFVDQIKPPVINIPSVTNFISICKSISAVVGEQSFTCKARIDVLTVQANNSDVYRKITKHLQAIGIQHYTYQFKNEKAYRVVIRHLHPSTPVELIKEELGKIGFSVIDACNVLQRGTRTPLPLFFVNLKPASNNKDIFSLRTLLFTSIKVEEPHKKEVLPQCTRCQGFNHTQKYCNLNPICVKCAGPHLTQTCAKTRDTPATCAHCQQAHPANYRGCSIYKDLVKRARSRSGHRAAPSLQPAASQPVAANQPAAASQRLPGINSGLHYVGPARLQPPPRQTISSGDTRLSYASAVKSSQPHPTPLPKPETSPNPPQRSSRVFIPPPNPASDLTTALNSLNLLINNLQVLISPLTEILQKVTSILSVLQS